MIDESIKKFSLEHRGQSSSIGSVEGRLKQVKRLLGTKRLPDLTENAMRDYVTERLDKHGVSGRTCNMELGKLSRAIGRPWSQQWPGLRPQYERKDVGHALSQEDKQRLLEASSKRPGWRTLATLIRILLLSGMRVGEALKMIWGQIDFERCTQTVGWAKTEAGTGRVIPLNADLQAVLELHRAWFVR